MSGKNKKNRKNRYIKPKIQQLKQIFFFFKLVAVTGIMGAVFIFFYQLLISADFFSIKNITIEGLKKLSGYQILCRADIKKGDNIFFVNLVAARKKILKDPKIAQASVSRLIPDKIVIKIKENVPIAVIKIRDKFIASENGIYKRKDKTDTKKLPVITGLRFSDINIGQSPGYFYFNAVIEALKLGNSRQSIVKIKKINVDRETGLTLYTDTRLGKINLGYNNYQLKFDKLKKLFIYLKKTNKNTKFKSVDVSNIARIIAGR